jgi:hypothetical protein
MIKVNEILLFSSLVSQELRILMEKTNGKPTKLDINEFIKREYKESHPKLVKISDKLREIHKEIDDILVGNASKLKSFIIDIAQLQNVIRQKFENKLTIFDNLVEKHEKDMFNFEILEKFPKTYADSIKEIGRRNEVIMSHEEIIDILENLIERENEARAEYIFPFILILGF